MTILTAHSGADGRPDNSLEFVRYAAASGADALEIDVRRAADGELRLGHDAADPSGPSLLEAFALLREAPGMRMNCDLKEHGLEKAVCALAREAGVDGRLILTGSADAGLYAASADMRGTAELWVNIEEYVPGIYSDRRERTDRELSECADRILKVCTRCGLTTVNTHWLLARPPFTERLYAEGVGLSVWTVNDEDLIRRFLKENIYALTTRSIATALEERKRLTV